MAKKLYLLSPNLYRSRFATDYPTCSQLDDINTLFSGTGDKATLTASGQINLGMIFAETVSGEAMFMHNPSFDPADVTLTGDNFTVASSLVGEDGVLWTLDPVSPALVNYNCSITGDMAVGDTIQGFVPCQILEVPMYDDGYTIEYSFPAFYEFEGALKTFIDYNSIGNNQLNVVYKYKWSGLNKDEAGKFINLISFFSNSYQPFYILDLNADNDSFTTLLVLIDNNNIVINKDMFDLYTIELNLIDVSINFLPEDEAPVPTYLDGWGYNWGNNWGAPNNW